MIPAFFDFLESKPLYYKEIDHERIHRAYARMRDRISSPAAIHIVGTNGKGSTGRMAAYLAYNSSKAGDGQISVGHYSSPHILRFNERIWMDGDEIGDEKLEEAHRKLFVMLGREVSENLSYFEYTTLLALLLFEKCDLIILEAGLGGEYDATNVVENKILTVVTPIGFDHQNFLGNSIEEIAETKLRSIAFKGRVLLAEQPHTEVYAVAEKIAGKREADLWKIENESWRIKNIEHLLAEKAWPSFLYQNALTAFRALEIVGIKADPEKLRELELFGRFYPIAENLRIDVGHNPLAARAIVKAMRPGTVLIYNSLNDKDYKKVLSILKPRLKRVELIPIETERATLLCDIGKTLDDLGIEWKIFNGIVLEKENYLVFGSFYTVAAFLESTDFKSAG